MENFAWGGGRQLAQNCRKYTSHVGFFELLIARFFNTFSPVGLKKKFEGLYKPPLF